MTAAALTYQGRRRRFEVIFMAATGALGALPTFLAATLLAGVFAVWLRWLPVAGSGTWQQLVLPVLAISLAPTLLLARIIRLETLNVLAQDYIRTARSKRLPSLHLYAFHVLPNVLTAALTVAGLLFANLVGGTVLAENVFARVGLGTSLVQAVIAKDYPVVQGIVLVLGCTVVLVNLVVDVVLGLIDPRTLTRKA
jgi:peptide/nickel transport system permease protein